MGNCSHAIQKKIVGRRDVDTKILNDTIKLLIAIKEHSLNFHESRHEMSIIVDAIRVFLNSKQNRHRILTRTQTKIQKCK